MFRKQTLDFFITKKQLRNKMHCVHWCKERYQFRLTDPKQHVVSICYPVTEARLDTKYCLFKLNTVTYEMFYIRSASKKLISVCQKIPPSYHAQFLIKYLNIWRQTTAMCSEMFPSIPFISLISLSIWNSINLIRNPYCTPGTLNIVHKERQNCITFIYLPHD